MKKTTLLFVFICLIISGFAQNSNSGIQYDPRLVDVLTPEEFSLYEREAPAKLWSINYDLLHTGYVDSKLPDNYMMMNDICNYAGTGKTCNIADMIASKKFNPFDFGLTSDPQKYVVYPIDDTGFYVILYPTDEFARTKNIERKKMGF